MFSLKSSQVISLLPCIVISRFHLKKAFDNNVSRSVKLRKASEQMGFNDIRRMKKGLKNWAGCYCGSVGGC